MLFSSPYYQNNYNTPLLPTRIYVVPNVLLKERPKNVIRPIVEPKPNKDNLEICSISLKYMVATAR
jgi:hypothetical protein